MGSDVPRVKRERVPASEPRIERRPKMHPIQKRLLTILGVCVVGGACDGVSSSPMAPSLSVSSAQSGELHLTKNCTGTYNLNALDFCTITESTLSQLQLGSTV